MTMLTSPHELQVTYVVLSSFQHASGLHYIGYSRFHRLHPRRRQSAQAARSFSPRYKHANVVSVEQYLRELSSVTRIIAYQTSAKEPNKHHRHSQMNGGEPQEELGGLGDGTHNSVTSSSTMSIKSCKPKLHTRERSGSLTDVVIESEQRTTEF